MQPAMKLQLFGTVSRSASACRLQSRHLIFSIVQLRFATFHSLRVTALVRSQLCWVPVKADDDGLISLFDLVKIMATALVCWAASVGRSRCCGQRHDQGCRSHRAVRSSHEKTSKSSGKDDGTRLHRNNRTVIGLFRSVIAVSSAGLVIATHRLHSPHTREG